jgi:ABC-type Fe3+ transport system substrate-binding protein
MRMKYLRHKEKGVLVPYNPAHLSDEWEEYEEPAAPVPTPEVVERKKPGPKPKVTDDGADRS